MRSERRSTLTELCLRKRVSVAAVRFGGLRGGQAEDSSAAERCPLVLGGEQLSSCQNAQGGMSVEKGNLSSLTRWTVAG